MRFQNLYKENTSRFILMISDTQLYTCNRTPVTNSYLREMKGTDSQLLIANG